MKCYQRINCETFFKLWSEKCKMLCYINHLLVTMVAKRTRWVGDPLLLSNSCLIWSKVFVPNLRKIRGVKIVQLHYLNYKLLKEIHELWDALNFKIFLLGTWLGRLKLGISNTLDSLADFIKYKFWRSNYILPFINYSHPRMTTKEQQLEY